MYGFFVKLIIPCFQLNSASHKNHLKSETKKSCECALSKWVVCPRESRKLDWILC